MLAALICLVFLAAANGANDVSRAAATLLGGRVTTYARAMRWTVGFTFAGSLMSGWLAAGVARRFAAALGTNPQHLALAIPAVLLGASLWIGLATWRRLPVATTHALVGCLLGVTWMAGGWAACRRIDLVKGFVIPLLASPVLACVASVLLSLLVRRMPSPRLVPVDRLHWFSAGMTALSRGVNDSAKIWAILLPLSITLGMKSTCFVHLTQITVALGMLGGSILAGRRVTESLAFGIVPISGMEGSTANLVTSTVIIGASLLGFPVASSHVVSGAILGVGLAGHRTLLRWKNLATIASAWVLTLPVTAFIAMGLYVVFGYLEHAVMTFVAIAVVAGAGFAGRLLLQTRHLIAAPQLNRLIIFVCNSNTSRSPMAAQICAALLARAHLHGRFTVLSRGITATEGQALAPFAAEALESLRVPVAPHGSSNLDEAIVQKADLIFCMTAAQVQEVLQLFPDAGSKILRLDPRADIANPAGKDRAVFDQVAQRLAVALDARLNGMLAA